MAARLIRGRRDVRNSVVFGCLCAVAASCVANAAFAQTNGDTDSRELTGTTSPPGSEPELEPDLPRLRGADLRRELPDLQISSWPPPAVLGFGLVNHWPFDLFSLGVSLEGYPIADLRLGFSYAFGILAVATGQDGDLSSSNYVEALVGVRLFGIESERSVDLVPDDGSPWWRPQRPRPKPILKAWLPSHHALLVEAGLLSGTLSFRRCEANCVPDPANGTMATDATQLVMIAGGFRYVYFIHTRSGRRPEMNRDVLTQVYAHLITRPLYDPGDRFWFDRTPVTRSLLGGRLGVELPFCATGCTALDASVGYLPVPGTVLLGLGFSGGLHH